MISWARANFAGCDSRGMVNQVLRAILAGRCVLRVRSGMANARLDQFRLLDLAWGSDERGAIRAFGILENISFKVADDHAIGIAAEHIIGVNRDFATASRRIYHILRHGI